MKNMIRKSVFSHMVVMLVCASVMLAAFVVLTAADDPVVTYFRVEGRAGTSDEFSQNPEYKTIFADYVTVPKECNVTTTTGNTWHLYVNESNWYRAVCTAGPSEGNVYWEYEGFNKTIGATSVLCALQKASEQDNFTYNVTDVFWTFFVEAIEGQGCGGAWGWCYKVWNPDDVLHPGYGAAEFLLGYPKTDLPPPHEQVLWHWCASGDFFPLKVAVDKTNVAAGEDFTATVSYSKYESDSGWFPAAGATIYIGTETFTTGDNGTVKFFMESDGSYPLKAKKSAGSIVYIDSDNRTTVNVSGGPNATWWTQTNKSDFASGTHNRVDTSVSPGNILLEQGGPVTEDYVLDGETATLGGEHFYNNFTLINGATLNVPLGKILRVHANYIEIDSTSSINATGKGCSGGAGGAGDGNDGKGRGVGCFGEHNSTYGGGGGGGAHGGDGRYGGKSKCDANAKGGAGLDKYGKECRWGDDSFYKGSGGGGGAGNGIDAGGNGSYGGGAVVLEGMSLENETTIVINGKITAEGSNATDGNACGCGGGGGGSGGTILIKGKNISIANGVLSVKGGDAGDMGGTFGMPNVITNSYFEYDSSNWSFATVAGSPTGNWESTGYSRGGSVNIAKTGSLKDGEGYWEQNISTLIPADSEVKLQYAWKKCYANAFPQQEDIYITIVKPDDTTVDIASETGAPGSYDKWYWMKDINVSSHFDQTGEYKLRLRYDYKTGNDAAASASGWFDIIKLEVSPPSYREDIQHHITGISTADDYELQIEYYTAGDSEAFTVYLYNFSTSVWNNTSTIQGGSSTTPNMFTFNLTDTDYISDGELRVRYLQPEKDLNKTSLMLDYCRVKNDTSYIYVTSETVHKGGTSGISGAQSDDGSYEDIYEENYPFCCGGGGGGGAGGHIKVFFESIVAASSGHNVKGGAYGKGEYSSDLLGGFKGTGDVSTYWYNYTKEGETYSHILPFWGSGNLTSAAHDTNYSADFSKIYWCAATPSNTSVKFQIATNNDNSNWDFKGPDGTSSTYYETSNASIWSGHDGDRYIKYKAFLNTTAVGNTPTVSKAGITYREESAFPEVPAITPLGFLLALLSLFGLAAITMRKMFK